MAVRNWSRVILKNPPYGCPEIIFSFKGQVPRGPQRFRRILYRDRKDAKNHGNGTPSTDVIRVEDTERMMREAGLVDIRLMPNPAYVKTLDEMQDPLYRKIVDRLPAGTRPNEFLTSLDVVATKPLPS
jgi:hypothetical protein